MRQINLKRVEAAPRISPASLPVVTGKGGKARTARTAVTAVAQAAVKVGMAEAAMPKKTSSGGSKKSRSLVQERRRRAEADEERQQQRGQEEAVALQVQGEDRGGRGQADLVPGPVR